MRFRLNGKAVDVTAPLMKRLLDVLREDCGLTGTKEGCGEGECGACTVLVDGRPANACLIPFGQVHGADVVTVEGLTSRQLPAAFAREGGTQCGFCTPGVVMTASVLPAPSTPEEMRAAFAGHICRCTGYAGIYRAVAQAQGQDTRPAPRRAASRADGRSIRPARSAVGSKPPAPGSHGASTAGVSRGSRAAGNGRGARGRRGRG